VLSSSALVYRSKAPTPVHARTDRSSSPTVRAPPSDAPPSRQNAYILPDGSEDERNAEPVAEELGVEYVCPDEDRGAHAARSIGAQRARGKYVNFLDDDRLIPE